MDQVLLNGNQHPMLVINETMGIINRAIACSAIQETQMARCRIVSYSDLNVPVKGSSVSSLALMALRPFCGFIGANAPLSHDE